jgi:hypothetical protein
MIPVSLAFIQHFTIGIEIQEICREKGGSNNGHLLIIFFCACLPAGRLQDTTHEIINY